MMKRLIKFGLVGLIGFFSFISFSSASNYLITVSYDGTVDVCSEYDLNNCFTFPGGGEDYEVLNFYVSGVNLSPSFDSSVFDYYLTSNSSSCPSQYTSSECQQEYSLMPISSCNSEFCELNNLCPVFTGNTGTNWSALFINDIEHVGAGLINITIPQEIDWDYIYTGNGDEFDLDVKGYNVDSDYIEGIINTQTTKPNNIDFNNTLTGLLPLFIPGLVIILFIYFIFRFLKKVF